jgi:hypothetical protein
VTKKAEGKTLPLFLYLASQTITPWQKNYIGFIEIVTKDLA